MNATKTNGPAATPPGAAIRGMPLDPTTTLVVDQHEKAWPVLAVLRSTSPKQTAELIATAARQPREPASHEVS